MTDQPALSFMPLDYEQRQLYSQLIEQLRGLQRTIPDIEGFVISALIAAGSDTTTFKIGLLLEDLSGADVRDLVAHCYSRPIATPEPVLPPHLQQTTPEF